MTLKRGLQAAHLFFASLYLLFVLFGSWAKRGDPDQGFFASNGGSGYGIVAVALGVILVILAIMRIMGRSRVLPGLGVEQLTIMLGVAAVTNIFAFIVGWLATFPSGTGWALPAAYFPASLIPQIGLLTISATEPGQGIRPLSPGNRRVYSVVALLAGLGVALFPFMTWLSAGPIDLAAFDGSYLDEDFSGPRLGYILLIVGVVVAVVALMRLRPQGLAEPGPNLLLSHVLLSAGLVAVLVPFATLISAWRQKGVDPGIGIWLGLLAGAVLVAFALLENRQRGAVAA